MVQITCFISFLPLPSGLFPSQCNLNGGEQACKGAANEPSQTPCPWSTMQLPSLGRTVFPSCRKSTNPSQNSAWNQVLVNHVGGPHRPLARTIGSHRRRSNSPPTQLCIEAKTKVRQKRTDRPYTELDWSCGHAWLPIGSPGLAASAYRVINPLLLADYIAVNPSMAGRLTRFQNPEILERTETWT